MLNVTVDEIQRDPSKYLRQVEAGETFMILQADKAIAELRPITSSKQLRPFGLCAGEFTVPDDFDAPLPEDILSTIANLAQMGGSFGFLEYEPDLYTIDDGKPIE
jgi:antitoxin (DNA-binding transcriptional repressor) of toxin-antitoxin stability system